MTSTLLRHGELVGFDQERQVLDEARQRAAEVIHRACLSQRVYVPWRHQA